MSNEQRKRTGVMRRAAAASAVALLFVVLAVGCGRENKDRNASQGGNGTVTGTVTTTPEATLTPSGTETPTCTPTPGVPFVKQAYETAGRDDVFRVPVKELAEDWYLSTTEFAGDYALLWLCSPDSFATERRIFVLCRPGESREQYRLETEYSPSEPKVFEDGTVVLEDRKTGLYHVYDNTLTELRSFLPGGEKGMKWIGASPDRMLWFIDETETAVLATDLNGQAVGGFSCAPGYRMIRYLGSRDGKRSFLARSEADSAEQLMILPADGSDPISPAADELKLGEDWKNNAIPCSGPNHEETTATWFFHLAGDYRKGCVFPKESMNEEIGFLGGTMLCSNVRYELEDGSYRHDYRLYDMEKRTVSGVLRDAEIEGSAYMYVLGPVGDGNVLLQSSKPEGGSELLLWTAGDTVSPIDGFCDLAKDDIAACLTDRVKKAKECGIVITPDRTEDDGTATALGDLVSEIDLVNTFLLAEKNDPDALKPVSGDAIHPENKRCNDGAHFTFKRHVFSEYYLKEYGEKRRSAFFRFVDAVLAGEDRFQCPDDATEIWCCGVFSSLFFPIAQPYITAAYEGDGWAKITYKIPKEEFLEKERAFEERICEILNDVLEDDYTDTEKALALYEFMTEYCTYDTEMLEHLDEWSDRQSTLRCLTEQTGVCWEIASLYEFLLLQCGVNAEPIRGIAFDENEPSHEWNYITLDGQGYQIDATWGITDRREPDLKYFLFTDELRETRDGYEEESFEIGGAGFYNSRKRYTFEADDERFEELWSGRYLAFDEEEKCIYYIDPNGNVKRFPYGR